MGQISGHEHAGCGGGERLRIDLRPAGPAVFDIGAAFGEEVEICRLPHGQQDRVAGDCHAVGVVVDWSETAVLVVHTQAAAEEYAANNPLGVAFDLERAPAVHPADAFFVSLEYLQRVGGHFFERFERNQAHAPRAGQTGRRTCRVVGDLAEHGPGDVVGDIAAADHHNLAADLNRFVERHRPQQVNSAEYAGAAFARQSKTSRSLRADGDNHRRKIAPQLGERYIAPDRHAVTDLDPQGFDHGHLAADQFARQSVGRHADGKHSGRHPFRLENHRPEAQQRQIVTGGQSGRPRANDRHRLTVGLSDRPRGCSAQQCGQFFGVGGKRRDIIANRSQHLVRRPCFGTSAVADETLECADGNRPVVSHKTAVGIDSRHFAPPASGLAGRAADPPADRSQRVRTAGNEVCLVVVSGGDRANVSPGIGVHGACDLAGDEAAMVAVARHFNAKLRCE